MLTSIETTAAQWYKKIPFHLPVAARSWIATNAWWLLLVSIGLSVIGILSALNTILWANNALNTVVSTFGAIGIDLARHTFLSTLSLWISIATTVLIIIIQARAITPVKLLKKSGWSLIFASLLIAVIGNLISSFITGNILIALITTAVTLAVGGYLLFEIRDMFGAHSKKHTAPHTSSASSPSQK